MATDVVLDDRDGNWITFNAGIVRTTATDIMIDNPQRRQGATRPRHRRALVHDTADGLTVNFNHDYTGGLTLHGVVRITPKKLAPDTGPPDPFVVPQIPNVVIDGGVEFLWNHGTVTVEGGPAQERVNLQTLILTLQQEVIDLRARVEALGG